MRKAVDIMEESTRGMCKTPAGALKKLLLCMFRSGLILFFASVCLLALFLVAVQDILIFPGVFHPSPEAPPAGTESFFVETSDGERIEIWTRRGVPDQKLSGYTVIMVHGNFETVVNTSALLKWWAEAGANTYSYDFRGYGNSSGWPSETGLYLDTAAVWGFVKNREENLEDKLIIMGNSVGTGIAAELATVARPRVLLLTAPYSDLPSVVGERALFKPLLPFLWYELPTLKYLRELDHSACLILVHGEKDKTISLENSLRIADAFQGRDNFYFLRSSEAGHNDIFYLKKDEMMQTVGACLGS